MTIHLVVESSYPIITNLLKKKKKNHLNSQNRLNKSIDSICYGDCEVKIEYKTIKWLCFKSHSSCYVEFPERNISLVVVECFKFFF